MDDFEDKYMTYWYTYDDLLKGLEMGKKEDDTKETVVHCNECKFAYRNSKGELNLDDLVCTYWESDGLSGRDYCSKGEKGKYVWDEDNLKDLEMEKGGK